jgi:hypothetical protein
MGFLEHIGISLAVELASINVGKLIREMNFNPKDKGREFRGFLKKSRFGEISSCCEQQRIKFCDWIGVEIPLQWRNSWNNGVRG